MNSKDAEAELVAEALTRAFVAACLRLHGVRPTPQALGDFRTAALRGLRSAAPRGLFGDGDGDDTPTVPTRTHPRPAR